MTIYEATTVLSIAGPAFALVLLFLHRREIAYMLTGDSSHLDEEDLAARTASAPAPASEKPDITKSLVLIEESMETEDRVAEALRAAPNMADLADRLSASRRSLQKARESLVHFAKSN